MKIELKKYGLIISDKDSGNIIYTEIKKIISENNNCIIDFKDVKSMATFNAKQIFGKLYLELGSNLFFEKIEIKNASDDLKLIIRLGIQSALEDKK
ncbi:protein of unknown function [Flavobacterium frigidimaris]|jgi:hypothetical protein|nr:protein of unknown function [Flavobacterium frigidimaris]